MANGTTMVHEPENARAALTPGIPARDHQRVLRDGRDVPEDVPAVGLALSEVGIAGKTVWLLLPQGRIPFQAAVGVDLPASHRGIHMSRIEEVIARLYVESFDDPVAYARTLAAGVLGSQQGSRVHVRLEGRLPLVRRTPVSDRTSVESVDVTVEVDGRQKQGQGGLQMNVVMGVEVPHMTACPCTQRYNQVLEGTGGNSLPLPTHSQRARTRLEVEDATGRLRHRDLLACLEACLHITQGLLKRPDEAEVVLSSHRRPQFAEDVVREVAREVARRLGATLPPDARVHIESLSLESIHTHDVRCRLDVGLGEIPRR